MQLWSMISLRKVVGFCADMLTDISSMYHIEGHALNLSQSVYLCRCRARWPMLAKV